MTARSVMAANRLIPGDVILHRSKPYRVKVMRLVPPDGATPAHVEIEAAPAAHDCQALVTRYEPETEIVLAEPDDVPRTSLARTAVQTAMSLLTCVVLVAGAHQQQAPTCQLYGPIQQTALFAPCRLDLAVPRGSAPRERHT